MVGGCLLWQNWDFLKRIPPRMTNPTVYFPEYPLPWEMSVAERFALTGLLARWQPSVVLEIGTHYGGSLQVLAAAGRRVYSIDLDPTVALALRSPFPQVEFLTGPSAAQIPRLLAALQQRGEDLEFVLVDGDHSAAGVKVDIEALLQYCPRKSLRILLHDSFNPDCRAGIRSADWAGCPHVHAVELDFVPGTFHAAAQGGAFARSLWGGFALAELQPEPRRGGLVVTAGQEALHRLAFRGSTHRWWHKVWRRCRRSVGK